MLTPHVFRRYYGILCRHPYIPYDMLTCDMKREDVDIFFCSVRLRAMLPRHHSAGALLLMPLRHSMLLPRYAIFLMLRLILPTSHQALKVILRLMVVARVLECAEIHLSPVDAAFYTIFHLRRYAIYITP